jgi:hypothetical protein
VEDVPLANNLTVEKRGGGVEARWLTENAEGKDVAFRVFFAAPPPDQMTMTTGDGWLAYVRPVARNKYLDAKVAGVRNARFLTVLYPDLVADPKDDVAIERVGEGARLRFRDGTVHVIAIKGKVQKAAGEKQVTNAQIAFWELSAAGKLNAGVLVRGSAFEPAGATVKAPAKVNVLALDFRKPKEVCGYLSTEEEVTLSLWLGAACQEAAFVGKRINVTHDAGAIVLHGLRGAGELRLKMRD